LAGRPTSTFVPRPFITWKGFQQVSNQPPPSPLGPGPYAFVALWTRFVRLRKWSHWDHFRFGPSGRKPLPSTPAKPIAKGKTKGPVPSGDPAFFFSAGICPLCPQCLNGKLWRVSLHPNYYPVVLNSSWASHLLAGPLMQPPRSAWAAPGLASGSILFGKHFPTRRGLPMGTFFGWRAPPAKAAPSPRRPCLLAGINPGQERFLQAISLFATIDQGPRNGPWDSSARLVQARRRPFYAFPGRQIPPKNAGFSSPW